MSKVKRNGISQRPSWNYMFDGWPGPERAAVEMLESCRNTMEEVRDELRKLNALLACRNFTSIPTTLRGIRKDLKNGASK